MNYIQTEIDDVWLIEPKVFHDARGYFMEAFKGEDFLKSTATSSTFPLMTRTSFAWLQSPFW